MPTVRNARGSDLIITDADETIFLGIQSKALGKRSPVPLGLNLDTLRSDWWVITMGANSDHPTSFVMTLAEVKERAYQDKNKGACWLQPPAYDQPEFREAWHRLDGASPEIGP